MMISNKVIFKFTGNAADQQIDFKVSDSIIKRKDDKNIKIHTSDITVNGGKGSVTITVDASRSGNSDVALWYKSFVQSNTRILLYLRHVLIWKVTHCIALCMPKLTYLPLALWSRVTLLTLQVLYQRIEIFIYNYWHLKGSS
jgi:hypothetical protein